MRVRKDFILREVADEYIVIPVGEAALSIRGLISLSESGHLLYQKLQQETDEAELTALLQAEYEVSQQQALADVREFLDQMRAVGMLEESA